MAGIILVYETLGGFRAVAWTDAIQGCILMFGFAALLFLMFRQFGSLESATRLLEEHSPEKLSPPAWSGIRDWVSYLFIVAIGCSLYPQAIQRIYCAKNSTTLRRSLMVMACLPLVTTSVSIIAGIMGRAYLPDLTPEQTELLTTCAEVQQETLLGRWPLSFSQRFSLQSCPPQIPLSCRSPPC